MFLSKKSIFKLGSLIIMFFVLVNLFQQEKNKVSYNKNNLLDNISVQESGNKKTGKNNVNTSFTENNKDKNSLQQKSPQLSSVNSQAVQVLRIIDGDTIVVQLQNSKISVRLLGINAPELHHPQKPVECFAQQAKDKLEELLAGHKVFLKTDTSQLVRDKYGRLLAYVYTDSGLFVNLEMVRLGFAYEYTYSNEYFFQKEFKQAQEFSKKNKLGLWSDKTCRGEMLQVNSVNLIKENDSSREQVNDFLENTNKQSQATNLKISDLQYSAEVGKQVILKYQDKEPNSKFLKSEDLEKAQNNLATKSFNNENDFENFDCSAV